MTRAIVLAALLGLAACGADDEPIQPTASLGVGIGDSGVNLGGRVGLIRGPISIGVSL